jgi:hypothetical protein
MTIVIFGTGLQRFQALKQFSLSQMVKQGIKQKEEEKKRFGPHDSFVFNGILRC